MAKFDGIWTALVTPLKDGHPYEIDWEGFDGLLEEQKQAKVTGVIPCGTTGESPTLQPNEAQALIKTTIAFFKGSGIRVFAGTGSNDTKRTIEFSKWASDNGADGVLVVTPYYNKPSQAGLTAHYLAVADAIKCDLMLYNVPGRTGVSLAAETVEKLAHHPRINAIKEATGNPAFASEIITRIKDKNLHMEVLSGDDTTFLSLLGVGAVGNISVASNLIPKDLVSICDLHKQGRATDALALFNKFYPVFRDLFVESNPVPIKFALNQTRAWCSSQVRPPLAPLTEASQSKLLQSLKNCGLQVRN